MELTSVIAYFRIFWQAHGHICLMMSHHVAGHDQRDGSICSEQPCARSSFRRGGIIEHSAICTGPRSLICGTSIPGRLSRTVGAYSYFMACRRSKHVRVRSSNVGDACYTRTVSSTPFVPLHTTRYGEYPQSYRNAMCTGELLRLQSIRYVYCIYQSVAWAPGLGFHRPD